MASQSGIDGGGFSIDATKPLVAEQSFDVAQVKQGLQKYMKEHLEDISKCVGSARAKEDKSKVNPSRLAVVAIRSRCQQSRSPAGGVCGSTATT
jgi:hypothetical protein